MKTALVQCFLNTVIFIKSNSHFGCFVFYVHFVKKIQIKWKSPALFLVKLWTVWLAILSEHLLVFSLQLKLAVSEVKSLPIF